MTRPTAEENMLDIARVAAQRSTCSRLQVGAVLARDGRVLSTGRNGAPAGLPHCVHDVDAPCTVSAHAEANAIVFAARHGVATAGADMYCTHAPCLACAALIVNAGVRSVAYSHAYRDPAGVALLHAAGIVTFSYVPEIGAV